MPFTFTTFHPFKAFENEETFKICASIMLRSRFTKDHTCVTLDRQNEFILCLNINAKENNFAHISLRKLGFVRGCIFFSLDKKWANENELCTSLGQFRKFIWFITAIQIVLIGASKYLIKKSIAFLFHVTFIDILVLG
jgi:hypothetical protein